MNINATSDIYEIPPVGPTLSATQQFLNRRRARSARKSMGAGALAATVSVAIHVVLVSALVWNDGATRFKRDPNAEGAGASARESSQAASVTMVLINLPTVTPDTAPDETLTSKGIMSPNLALQILSADVKPAVPLIKLTQEDDSRTAEATGDEAERALLYGRYMGQIKARIARAWSRPRTPVGAREFSCQVQITQSPRGDVKEVELVKCNGDARWQMSLVAAINTASPLPAPPDPAIFASRLALAFDAVAYKAGASDYEYEQAEPARLASAGQ